MFAIALSVNIAEAGADEIYNDRIKYNMKVRIDLP